MLRLMEGMDRMTLNHPLFRFRLLGLFLFAIFLSGCATVYDKPTGLYLTYPGDPTTSITINWVDEVNFGPDLVYFRQKDEGIGLWKKLPAPGHRFDDTDKEVRRVDVKGLTPGAEYEFSLGFASDSRRGAVQRFRTLSQDRSQPIRFIVGGDMYGTLEKLDAMNQRAGKLDPQFIVLGGDLAYANDKKADRWLDWLQSWRRHAVAPDGRLIPMIVAIGNHEVDGGHGKTRQDARQFHSLFWLPENRTFYALDIGGHFSIVILDSGHTQPIDGAQAQWLSQALEQRKRVEHLFVAYHYPAWGTAKSPAGSTDPSTHSRSKLMQKNWCPLFEQYSVAAVFEHDHHAYKRTHPLYQGKPDAARGVLYLGDGAWGVKPRPIKRDGDLPYLARSESKNHLILVNILDDKRTYEAIDVNGKVFDRVEQSGQ